jgi:anti-sigma B factor antagonist
LGWSVDRRTVVQLDLDVAARGEWTVLTVRGDLDLATAPALRQRIVGLVAEGHRRFAVDLTALDFIDSIGLGMLVAGMKRANAVGGQLFVAADEDRIRSVFELTGLDEALGLVETVEAGVVGST